MSDPTQTTAIQRVAMAIEDQMASDDNSPEDLAQAAISAMTISSEIFAVNLCLSCKLATWAQTNGKFNFNGEGRCNWKKPNIVLPAAFGWIGSERYVVGGRIGRDEVITNCAQWFRNDDSLEDT